MKMEIIPVGDRHPADLVYRPQDYAFDTVPIPSGGRAAVLVNDLQLEFDASGRFLYVWGYCPHPSWQSTTALPPSAIRADIVLHFDEKPMDGVGYDLLNARDWPVSANWESGWVCIGNTAPDGHVTGVEFAPHAVAILSEGMLLAVWLHPIALPDV